MMSNCSNFLLSVKCLSAMAFKAFRPLVEYSSLVNPCTTNGQGPFSVPVSSSISFMVVDSGSLLEFDSL